MTMSDSKTTRRRFLTGASQAMVAGIAMGELGGVAQRKAHAVKTAWISGLPKKWDESYDVVIVGSGFAGLAAAWEAKKAGATVRSWRRCARRAAIRSSTAVAYPAAGSPLQEKKGIKDLPDQMLKDMLKAGLGLNHPALVKMVAEQSWPTVKWTIDELGVKYTDFLVPFGGHAVPRGYQTDNGSGSAIVQKQLAKLKEMGQGVKLQTYVEKILRDSDGRVKGLQVREGYRIDRAGSGRSRFIQAKRAVVLTHGGFSADVAFRTLQDPKLTDKMQSTNQPGATAELTARSIAHRQRSDPSVLDSGWPLGQCRRARFR